MTEGIIGTVATARVELRSTVDSIEPAHEDAVTDGQQPNPSVTRRKVLILSAGVGGGHEAAARAIHEELEEAGHQAITIDGLSKMGSTLDWFLRWSYAFQLRHCPWCYDLSFRLSGLPGIVHLLRVFVGIVYGQRLARAIEDEQPDLVLSTYPVVTAGLGWLRRTRQLAVPALAVVSDYNVHPLWVAPGIDRHLVVSLVSAPAAQQVGGEVCVIRPPVKSTFRIPADRAATRAAMDIPQNAPVALIVGGAWGLGDILQTAEQVVASGAHAILVAGRNADLRTRLEKRFHQHPHVRILGWTDKMPQLMAAADCLIQNAGGLTCLEAITVGLPIVIYRPIAGHGRLNARLMEQAGAAAWARDDEHLHALLASTENGTLRLAAPRRESGQPAAEAIVSALPQMVPASQLNGRRRPLLTILLVLAGITWVMVAPRPSITVRRRIPFSSRGRGSATHD